jgi:DNA-binding IclR family transcriptional regulator
LASTRPGFHIVERSSQAGAHADRDGAQAIHRAISLLREVAAVRGGACLSDLAMATGLAVSTAHRTLAALVGEGMLAKDARTRRYRPGPLLHELGIAARPALDVRRLIRPILERLAELTGDTAYLNVRSGSDALCLDLCEGSFPIKALPMSLGNRRPLGVGAAALAVLGALTPGEAALVLSRNAERFGRHGLSAKQIRSALSAMQERGYTVTTGRLGASYRGVAVPVSDDQGRFAIALSVSAIAQRLDPARIEHVASLLRPEARRLAQALSGQGDHLT